MKTIGSTAKSVLSSVTRIPDDDNVNPWQFGFFTAYRFKMKAYIIIYIYKLYSNMKIRQ